MKKSKRRFVASVEQMEGRLLLSAAPQFTVKNLGFASVVNGINSSGQVVGTYWENPYKYSAAVSNDNTLVPIGIWQSEGLSINDFGQVAGIDYGQNGSYSREFISSNGVTTYITDPGENVRAQSDINNLGNVVGSVGLTGTEHAFFYDGTMHDLGTFGGNRSIATGLNDSNQIAGFSYDSQGIYHSFFYDGSMHDLGNLGVQFTITGGINSSGQVTGSSRTSDGSNHAFISDPNGGALHDLGLIPNSLGTTGFAVNDQGHVVGDAQVGNLVHAFYYDGQTMMDLNELVPSNLGLTIQEACGINNSNQIAALGIDSTGQYSYALLLTPVSPTPVAPVITWANPADIVYGTPITSIQLNATADVPGTFTYNVAQGTVLHAGAAQILVATFTPTDTNLYTTATATDFINVTPAPLTVTANNATKVQGQVNPTFSGTIAGLVNGDTDVATYSTTATTSSPAGSYAIVPFLVDSNYAITFVNGTLTVTPSGHRPPPSPWV